MRGPDGAVGDCWLSLWMMDVASGSAVVGSMANEPMRVRVMLGQIMNTRYGPFAALSINCRSTTLSRQTNDGWKQTLRR